MKIRDSLIPITIFLGMVIFFFPVNAARALIILKPLYTLSHLGSGVGELLNPQGLALDPAGNLYVADTGNNRIQKFAPGGNLIVQVGGLGGGSQQFDAPQSIDASNGLFVWVADYNNHRLQKLDRHLNVLGQFESDENWPLPFQFQQPVDVVQSEQGDLFVADGAQNQVLKFDSFHKPVAVFGGIDAGVNRIQEIGKIAIQGTNRVFVTDRLAGKVLIFDYFGNFLSALSRPDFGEPLGLTLGTENQILFVTDAQQAKIFAFNGNGKSEPVQILKAGKQFQLKRPVGLAFFQKKLFVLDEVKSQILVFAVQILFGPVHR